MATQAFPVRYMGSEVSQEAEQREEVELERHREVFSLLNQGHCLIPLIRQCMQDKKERRISPQDITSCIRGLLKVHKKGVEHILELSAVIAIG